MKPTRCFTLILLALFATATLAQTPAAPTPADPAPATEAAPLPTDPTVLLQLAADANGLHAPTLKPWHIRATWQTLGDDKAVKDQGTLEEWWAGEKKYKLAFKSDTVDRVVYYTDHGTFVVKHNEGLSWQYATVQRLLTQPVVGVPYAAPMKTERHAVDIQQGTVTMHCVLQDGFREDGSPVMMMDKDRNSHPLEFRYCFSGNLPAIRAEKGPDGGQTVFNSLVQFQGQYLAQKIRSVGAGGTETDISLDVVEPMDTVVEADFVPPAGAAPVQNPTSVMVAAGVMAGSRIGGRNPEYPEMAKINRVQGTVVLKAVISKEGLITDLSVISGPKDLQKEALDAVRTWTYRPYLLNGAPVAVETQVNVVFQFGR